MLRNNKNARLYVLAGILAFWGTAICARLVYLQVFCYGEFAQRAQRQQQRTTEVAAKRGLIYERAGRELAMSMSVESVFAVPSDIPDLANTVSLISRITKSDPRELLAKCHPSKSFCWVARKTDPDVSARIHSLNLKGIYFQKESKRFYPKNDLAAQVLGYVGMDDEGLSGIERKYNDDLQGKAGRMLISVDARRKWFGSVEKQPEPGENVVLTIDERIQYIAERELETAMAETHSETGTVLVMNPHTGEVLALANRPTFNPNNSDEIKPERLKNHAVSDIYEPGSAFKLVTIAAGLEEKITTPNEVFDCQNGAIMLNGLRIRDHKPYGLLTVSKILANSSNVGAIKIALRLGEDRFYKYIRAFGFGQQTGIELPSETRGLTKPVSRWSKVSIGAISMGQEIGVTPLQLGALVSTIANDGVWVAPRIVATTAEPHKSPQQVVFHPANEHRVISPLTAAQLKQMMQGVVLEGTAKKAILDGYSSAGKTGTAQKIDPNTGAYSRSKYVATFAGFAPVNDPAITVAVILDSAVGLHQGGQIAAPVFRRVAQQVLEYMHISHDVDLPMRKILLARRDSKDDDLDEGPPDHPGAPLGPEAVTVQPVMEAKEYLETGIVTAGLRERIEPVSIAKEEKRSLPDITIHKPSSGTVMLDVEQGGIVVPSFVGKSVRAAVQVASGSGLDLDVVGSGVAREQEPVAGSHVAAGSRIVVKFAR
ncbi:MAG TPA: penicillin-binding transpeptidase domain-containing protein [Terriglobales bacterium]|jgi:cell division protein FtsI (penicillin-binding protein 3)|nr:penicillin-binding transpeptidase domain-containing protein [Terriglobales bacterium]